MPVLQQQTTPASTRTQDPSLVSEPGCECMLCDLPLGQDHGPVRWRVTVHFPGPYPYPGQSDMLLCDHCKESWLSDDWPEPYGNFRILRCVPV